MTNPSPARPTRVNELDQLFALCDRDHDGRINPVEFSELLESLSPEPTDPPHVGGFASIDLDADGYISLPEFRGWWDDE